MYFIYLKPFNCFLPVLSLYFALTCRVNTLVHSVLLWSNKCNNNNAKITPFIPVQAGSNLHMSQTPSHQTRDPRPTNCTPKDAQTSVFSTLPVLHTQDTFAPVLNFEVGHFVRHFLVLSFFWCCYERNSIHTASLSHFISLVPSAHHLFFYPDGDGCWIHVNVGCSACIYSTLLVVSLNDEPRLAHQRQQSVGSAFQFYYNTRNQLSEHNISNLKKNLKINIFKITKVEINENNLKRWCVGFCFRISLWDVRFTPAFFD